MIVKNISKVPFSVTWVEDNKEETKVLNPDEEWIIEPDNEDQLLIEG